MENRSKSKRVELIQPFITKRVSEGFTGPQFTNKQKKKLQRMLSKQHESYDIMSINVS